MSNTIRISAHLLGLAATASLCACKPSERQAAQSPAKASADVAGQAQAPAARARIDPSPQPATASRIIAREDIVVAGKPACALTVRYAGLIDQPVTWQGERCAELTLRFLTLAEIGRLGQAGKLASETRDDIAALAGGKTLYVEGGFASAIYPANAAERIYAVPLAD